MPVELDSRKCWLRDPTELKIKRYLYNTRLFFNEGLWIRDFFSSYFPKTKRDSKGEIYYDLSSLEPSCSVEEGYDLSEVKIPGEIMQDFSACVESLDAHVAREDLNFNQRTCLEEFTLPNPRRHPEAYQIVNDNNRPRLLVLWGLESELADGDLPYREVRAMLESEFSLLKGKRAQARASSELQSQTTDRAKSPEKTAKSKSRRKTPAWVYVALTVVGFLALREGAILYLGTSSTAMPIHRPDGFPSIAIESAESLELPNGVVVSLPEDRHRVSLTAPSQPGRYEVRVQPQNDSTTADVVTATVSNVRGDMIERPTARLMLSSPRVQPGESVTAFLGASYSERPIQKAAIGWGEANESLIPIEFPSPSSSPVFSETGPQLIRAYVEDDQGNWAMDSETLQVMPSDSPLLSSPDPNPRLEVGLYSIRESSGGYRVGIDLTGCRILGTAMDSIRINWDEGIEPTEVAYGTGYAEFEYGSEIKRTRIEVSMQNAEQDYRTDPAILSLDFQSQQMSTMLSPENRSNPLPQSFRSERILAEESNLGIEIRRFVGLTDHKRRVRMSLFAQASVGFQPFYDVTWRLEDPAGIIHETKDALEVEYRLAEGDYKIRVSGFDATDQAFQLDKTLVVRTGEEMAFPIKVMHLLVDVIPLRSPIQEWVQKFQ